MQRSRAFPHLIPSRATASCFLVQKVEGFGYFVAGKNHSNGSLGLKRKEAFQSEGQKRPAAKRKATKDPTKAVAKKKRVTEDMKKKMMETISKYDGEISALQEEVSRM